MDVAIMGYGVVGSGVAEVLKKNHDSIVKKSMQPSLNLKYILDIRDFPGDPNESLMIKDFNTILNDPDVGVVVETMGGQHPAFEFVSACLNAGKSVVSSNKELVAEKGDILLQIAEEKNVNFLFEASVGGGIPIIRPLNSSLTADEIREITGILNGTTNYILSQMSDEGWEFDKALKSAQNLGYAERNPEADIEGYDACRKIAILSSLAFGNHVDYKEIYTEGISKITARDIQYAKKMGMAVKLLASSKRENDNFYAMVAPFLVPKQHPIYSVNGVFNAIFVNGNVLGDIMFYGSGAGKLPTASAVVSDVVDAVKHLDRCSVFSFWSSKKLELTSIENAQRSFFVRVEGNAGEKFGRICSLFGSVKMYELDGDESEFGFVTDKMSEKEFEEKYSKIDGAIGRIRLI